MALAVEQIGRGDKTTRLRYCHLVCTIPPLYLDPPTNQAPLRAPPSVSSITVPYLWIRTITAPISDQYETVNQARRTASTSVETQTSGQGHTCIFTSSQQEISSLTGRIRVDAYKSPFSNWTSSPLPPSTLLAGPSCRDKFIRRAEASWLQLESN
ncbi:hypothetical protein CPB86DRAFT_240931 [Serendipita vermifera]|nr:hypothetical protein CPB86DRAFT_240931 [Serendipita vermifera]